MTDCKFDMSVKCNGHIVGGEWLFLLVYTPQGSCVQDTPLNFLNERTLKGTFFGNYTPCLDISSVFEKYMNKELELEKFITHALPILLNRQGFLN
uniref:alcohol dehydrogenase n=1 Tax=Solanum lycopersicum TaxID=4081 RepID=K4BGH8_SOLLC